MFIVQTVLKSVRKSMALALALSLLFTSVAYADSGDLDPEFYAFPVAAGQAGFTKSTVALQADEKIVIASRACDVSCDILLSRFNTDGSADVTFSEDGIQTTDLGAEEYVYGLAIQGDNKIVVSGSTCEVNAACDLFLARYTPDGNLDPTFDHDGIFMLKSAGNSHYYTLGGLAIRPNGKIVVTAILAPTHSNYPGIVLQVNKNGSLDRNFGTHGLATLRASGFSGTDLLLQPDGKIVIIGGVMLKSHLNNSAIVRLAANGSGLDKKFGNRGVQVTDFGGDNGATSVALSPDKKIVLTAWSWVNGYEGFHVARYKSNGSLDTTFNGSGIVTTDITPDADDAAYDALVQPDGKIVAVGSTNIYGLARDIVLVRYNSDGSLDTSFSTDGLVTINYYSQDYGYSIAAQADGKYVIAGLSLNIGCCGDAYSLTLDRVLP